jgi:copper chaperone CopZ
MTTNEASASTPATVELSIEGMHCGSCSALITETLLEEAGVASAAVDHETGRASIGYDPAVIDEGALIALVTEVGYPATSVG